MSGYQPRLEQLLRNCYGLAQLSLDSYFAEVQLPGLVGTLYSSPCHGPQGGDVHYLSVCGSGLLARVCLADVADHGETIAAIGREMHVQLRKSVDMVDERRVLSALDARLATGDHRAITTAALLTYYPPARRLTNRAVRYCSVSGSCSTAPCPTSDDSNRAVVLFGRSARSATSVTPAGPCASTRSTRRPSSAWR